MKTAPEFNPHTIHTTMLNFTATTWHKLEKQRATTGDYGEVLLTRPEGGRYILQFSVRDRFDTFQHSMLIPTRDARVARIVRDTFVQWVHRGDLRGEWQIPVIKRAMQKFVRQYEASPTPPMPVDS